MPARETYYWCKIIKFDFPTKKHVIRYEPLIESGNELYVHHAALFRCNHPNPERLEQYLDSTGLPCK